MFIGGYTILIDLLFTYRTKSWPLDETTKSSGLLQNHQKSQLYNHRDYDWRE